MFLIYTYWDFLLLTDTFQGLEANNCENTSFVQSETRKIVLHGVNLSMYEIKHFVSLYRFLWTLYCFLAYFAVQVFLMFSFFYGEIGAKQTKIGLRVHARRLTAVFSPLRIVRRFSSVLSRSILIVQRDRDETDDCEERRRQGLWQYDTHNDKT